MSAYLTRIRNQLNERRSEDRGDIQIVFIVIMFTLFIVIGTGLIFVSQDQDRKIKSDTSTVSDVKSVALAIKSNVITGPPVTHVNFESSDELGVITLTYADSGETKTIPVDLDAGTKIEVVFGQGEYLGDFLVNGWNKEGRKYDSRKNAYIYDSTVSNPLNLKS